MTLMLIFIPVTLNIVLTLDSGQKKLSLSIKTLEHKWWTTLGQVERLDDKEPACRLLLNTLARYFLSFFFIDILIWHWQHCQFSIIPTPLCHNNSHSTPLQHHQHRETTMQQTKNYSEKRDTVWRHESPSEIYEGNITSSQAPSYASPKLWMTYSQGWGVELLA